MTARKNRIAWLVFLLLEAGMVLLYLTNKNTNPLPEGSKLTEPMFSAMQALAISLGALFALLFVTWKVLHALAELFKRNGDES